MGLPSARSNALVTSQIIWTEEVESALEELESGAEDAVKKYVEHALSWRASFASSKGSFQ